MAPEAPRRGRPKLADRLRPPVAKSDHLARRLWRLKNHLSLGQNEFADFLSVNKGTLSYWISGARYPRPHNLRMIERLERLHGLPFDLPFPDKLIVPKGHRRKPRGAERKTVELDWRTVDPRRKVLWWSQTEIDSGIAGIEKRGRGER